jgi:hypothetical protein
MVNILNNASSTTFYDKDNITVRCLAHVIHLAVRAFLIELNAANVDDIDPDEVEVPGKMTEAMAEEMTLPDGRTGEKTDEELLAEQENDGVDIKVIVQKVSV